MAAVGTARSAPRMPSSLPPMSSATITVTALTPDLPRHHFRDEHVVFELLLDDEEDDDETGPSGTRPCRDRDGRDGGEKRTDDGDQFADGRDQRENVEIRNAHQPQADRRCDADDGAEKQLTTEPRTDLDGDGARHRVDARPVRGAETAAGASGAVPHDSTSR